MSKYGCAIFDLDGTLLNTELGIIKSLCEMTAQCHLPQIPTECYSRFIGPPIEQSVQEYFSVDQTLAEHAAGLFRETYKSKYLFDAEPYNGVDVLLKQLVEIGIRCAIATNKRHEYAVPLLKHFGLDKFCHPCVGTVEGILTTKDSVIRQCLFELGGAYDKAVYIGDTVHDKRGADIVGIDFIGITWGFGFKPGDNTILTADAPDELLNLIERGN